MIRFACPSCQTVYAAADQHAGQRTTCKRCAEKFLIPTVADGERPYEVESSSAPAVPVPEPAQSVEIPPAPEPLPLPPAVPVELAPCPTCGAKMSVRPEDVGYDLQCPFCQTTFRGEAATSPEPAPTAPVPEPESAGVEIAPCPKCNAELTVAASDVGGEVECPFCKTVYAAEKPKPKPNTLLARPSARPAIPPPPLPAKPTFDENEDDTTPIKVKFEKETPRDSEEEDDDDEYKPRRKTRRKRNNDPYDPYDPIEERPMEESNGIVCLLLGLACFFCCFIFAFWSVPFCKETIDKVNSGQMDPSAKPLATAGMVLSYLSVIVALMQAAFFCLGVLRG